MYHIYMFNAGHWSWFEGPYDEAKAARRADELNRTAPQDVRYLSQKWEPVAYESVLW